MLEKFLSLIEHGQGADGMSAERKQAAAAALMVEAARLDRDFDESEREAMNRIISEKFGLSAEVAQDLVAVAEGDHKMLYDDRVFLDGIRRGFSPDERRELLEMLWELSLADKDLHHFEEYLIWHMTQELGLSREDCEKARAAATAKAA